MAAKKTKAAPEPWRNRIVRHDLVDPRSLKPHSLNWRKHPVFQQDALRGVLREVGLVQDVIVTENGTILDGHLRVELALQDEQGEIPVKYVDLTEDEERMVLVTLDPMAALAETDAPKLRELLESVNSGEAAVQQMLSNLAETTNLIPAMLPDPEPPSYPALDSECYIEIRCSNQTLRLIQDTLELWRETYDDCTIDIS